MTSPTVEHDALDVGAETSRGCVMTDFGVAMSPDEIPEEVLREAVARALRGCEGQEVETTGHSLSLTIDGIDWWQIAAADQTLIEAVWSDDDEIDGLVAFDFDTGEWFVVQVDLLNRQTLVAVVPAADHDGGFRQVVRGWIWRHAWARGRFPTTIRSMFTGEAWLARELTVSLRGDEPALAELLETRGVDGADPTLPLELWDHVVMVNGDAPPSTLFEWAARGHDGPFATWVGGSSVTWDDTGQLVSPEDAMRLWLVCHYLALP